MHLNADTTAAGFAVQLSNPAISESCPMPFDEGRLWKGEQGAELKRQLQATFQNITRVMDCVGCEKCKLWGKLQTLGESWINYATFSDFQSEQCPHAACDPCCAVSSCKQEHARQEGALPHAV
jgi:hypothetical protein